MLKVVFNKDGSIRQYQLPTYVVKGSSGSIDALRLEVAVNDLNLSEGYIVQAHFKLPNGTTNSVYLGNTLNNLDVYGIGYPNGKYGYLTAAQTYYEGIVEASIVITSSLDTSTVLYTFPFRITVNPSTYDPQNNDELITHAQYYNLLSYIEGINTRLNKTSKNYTIDVNETAPTQEGFVANTYKRVDGTPIATYQEFADYVDTFDFENDELYSQDLSLDITPYYLIDVNKVVVRQTDLKSGDIIRISEEGYPDRFVWGNDLCSLEVSKIGKLPYYYVSSTDNVKSFLESNKLIDVEQSFSYSNPLILHIYDEDSSRTFTFIGGFSIHHPNSVFYVFKYELDALADLSMSNNRYTKSYNGPITTWSSLTFNDLLNSSALKNYAFQNDLDDLTHNLWHNGGVLILRNGVPSWIYDGFPEGWDIDNFIPDGQYYFWLNFDGIPMGIYDNENGLFQPSILLSGEEFSMNSKVLCVYKNMNNDSGYILFKSKNGNTYMVYDEHL